MEKGKIRMYWSACPKGCGVHGVADIGFEGAKAKDEDGIACDGVKIFLGGKATTKILEARQLSKAIPLKKAQAVCHPTVLPRACPSGRDAQKSPLAVPNRYRSDPKRTHRVVA